MDIYDLLRVLPLASAATWFVLAGLQVYRDRIHTWTETFFLLSCIFAALYATWDFLFFTAGGKGFAEFAGIMSTSSANVTSLFLLLVLWFCGLEDVVQVGSLWIPVYNAIVFLIVLAYIGAYSLGGIVNLYRLHRIVRKASPALAARNRGFLIVFALVIVLGLGTNGALGAIRSNIPPPFSTLALVIAAATIYTLYPGSTQRISEAVRRFQSRRYSIKASFLTFEDGTLIGSKARPGETVIDQDLFGATLDVIQNFMRTPFPILRGKSLSSISHGTYTLVVERARHTYLTVVLEGEETDQLRRQMRDLLLEFETNNRAVLAQWRGMPEEAKGTDSMLSAFFAEAPLL